VFTRRTGQLVCSRLVSSGQKRHALLSLQSYSSSRVNGRAFDRNATKKTRNTTLPQKNIFDATHARTTRHHLCRYQKQNRFHAENCNDRGFHILELTTTRGIYTVGFYFQKGHVAL
jgi:hypothetical protein